MPRPSVNAQVDGLEVDCAWPDHGLAVELDVRVTWRQLDGDSERVARDLGALLAD